jgi:AraC-like DNA-binding protein
MMEAIDNRKGEIDFRLQKMDVIYEQTHGAIDVTHRHDYFTVLIIDQATGTHIIDYNSFDFNTHEVHFVSPGQVHQVALTAKPKGSVITFSKDFLIKNNIPISFISNINLFQDFGNTPPLKLDKATFEKLNSLLDEMTTCLNADLNYGNRAVGALLQLFLIYCSNSTKLNKAQINEDNAGICILRDFKNLVEENFKDWHKVKDYAANIHISPKHLSQTVKNLTGKVAKDHIQDRITLEAKRLLMHTPMSIKEIAYNVGFDEPLHFSSFFKKNTGLSPSVFRES